MERTNPGRSTFNRSTPRFWAHQGHRPCQRKTVTGGQAFCESGDVLLHDLACRPAAGLICDLRLRTGRAYNASIGLQLQTASPGRGRCWCRGAWPSWCRPGEQPDELLRHDLLPERFSPVYPEPLATNKTVVALAWGFVDIRLVSDLLFGLPSEWSGLARGREARTLVCRGLAVSGRLVWVVSRFANLPLTTRLLASGVARCSLAWPILWQGN